MNKFFKKIIFTIGFLSSSAFTKTILLTAHPITNAIAFPLINQTDSQIISAVNNKLPANRQLHFLTNRGQKNLAIISQKAQAVLTINSLYPLDKLYPLARRNNIFLIPIDLINPLDGSDSLISVVNKNLKEHPIWLNPDNLSALFNFLTKELILLDKDNQAIYNQNNNLQQKNILQLIDQTQDFLSELNKEPRLLLLNPELIYFAQGLQLPSITLNNPQDLPKILRQYPEIIAVNYPDKINQSLKIPLLTINRLTTDNPIDQLADFYQKLQKILTNH